MREWRAIKTAPDDESLVVVYDGQLVDIGTSTAHGSDLYYCFVAGRAFMALEVTHWGPLPEPPEEEE